MRLSPSNPALTEARTVFPYRVVPVANVKRLLQPAGQNRKVGNGVDLIVKGKWRGMPCFTLTLEERATCDPACTMWAPCYGNNMRFAQRVDHRDPEALMAALEVEVVALLRTYRKIAIRLHILGDFFSARYARFWCRMLLEHKGLHLWGFTQYKRDQALGLALEWTNRTFAARSWIRFSNQGGLMSANVSGEGIPCPEQTGKTDSCMTCGICWSTDQPISFKEH